MIYDIYSVTTDLTSIRRRSEKQVIKCVLATAYLHISISFTFCGADFWTAIKIQQSNSLDWSKQSVMKLISKAIGAFTKSNKPERVR
jgi:hypothetical protein